MNNNDNNNKLIYQPVGNILQQYTGIITSKFGTLREETWEKNPVIDFFDDYNYGYRVPEWEGEKKLYMGFENQENDVYYIKKGKNARSGPVIGIVTKVVVNWRELRRRKFLGWFSYGALDIEVPRVTTVYMFKILFSNSPHFKRDTTIFLEEGNYIAKA